MNLRDEAKNSAQQPLEVAATDVKLTMNLHFSSINFRGEYLGFINSFERHLKGKPSSFRKSTCIVRVSYVYRTRTKFSYAYALNFCKHD
jgi:hypothetical protein